MNDKLSGHLSGHCGPIPTITSLLKEIEDRAEKAGEKTFIETCRCVRCSSKKDIPRLVNAVRELVDNGYCVCNLVNPPCAKCKSVTRAQAILSGEGK